ncbi:hypothetical protein [Brevundimonas sp.]|uniref:hypothetical protein n=1 Tax=Brevundimonas sp. TaxID=1871086 RepID=UPI001A212D74|nr:hypothetical protein [Brevundimonas sp.]MBJ7485546.1 hypothetical protein [Brevundimonas sp.]
MKCSLAGGALLLTLAIAGCDRPSEAPAPAEAPASASASTPAPVPPAPAAEPAAPAAAAAPAFAALYPGAELDGPPLAATGPAGPGGVVTFTTDADPDAVIAFYRERAEGAGMAIISSMNQGEARAYGAQNQANGANINVVAAPSEGRTSVQLTWSAGQ